jgi:hypothetical protein
MTSPSAPVRRQRRARGRVLGEGRGVNGLFGWKLAYRERIASRVYRLAACSVSRATEWMGYENIKIVITTG